jgi:hypothetical protein
MDVNTSTVARVLVIADWAVDPDAVIAACRRRAAESAATFALVVPAWLHGLDWLGDPYASRPCAARQVETLVRIATAAGLHVDLTAIGDPDPTSAIDDARAAYAATEILICRRGSRLGVFRPAGRVRRASRLPVHEVAIPARADERARRGWSVLRRGGHCDAVQAA